MAIVAASYVSIQALGVLVAGLGLVVAVGWPQLSGIPARRSQSAVIGAAAVIACAGSVTVSGPAYMIWFPAAVALGVGAVFVIQLLRGTGQSHRLESILSSSAGVFAVSLGAGWVAADRLALNAADSPLTLVAGLSLLLAFAASLLPWRTAVTAPLGAVAAALAGPVVALFREDLPVVATALIGGVLAVAVVAATRLVRAHPTPVSLAAAATLGITPVLAVGSVVYYLDKLLLS